MSTFEPVEIVLGPRGSAPVTNTQVMAELVAPGIAITPEVAADDYGNVFYLGGFSLTHLQTGRRLNGGSWGGSCINCIRAFTKVVIESGIDWTRSVEELKQIAAERGEEITKVMEAAAECCDAEENTCDGW